MFRSLLGVAVAMMAPVAAHAFTQCAVTPLGGPSASIAEEGSNPVVSGTWAYTAFTKGPKVFVTAAADRGATPGTLQTLFDQPGSSRSVRLAASGKNVFVVWQHNPADGAHLMFAASHKNAQAGSWSAPLDLGPMLKSLPQISADGDAVHIVYVLPNGTAAVASSANSGTSFTAPVPLEASAGEVVIGSHGQDVYAAWEVARSEPQNGVDFAVSHDGGATFSVRNVSDAVARSAREPILSVNPQSGHVSLVWREDAPIVGVYLQSSDEGQTFSAPLVIDTPARQFMVQDTDGYVYVSYLKEFTVDGQPDWQVQLATSVDGGKTFPSVVNLSGPSGISALDNDNLRPIAWANGGKIRVTGVMENGVYIWGGIHASERAPVFLGPGMLASPAGNVATWLAPSGVVTSAYCQE